MRVGLDYSRQATGLGLAFWNRRHLAGLWSWPSLSFGCAVCGAGWVVLFSVRSLSLAVLFREAFGRDTGISQIQLHFFALLEASW